MEIPNRSESGRWASSSSSRSRGRTADCRSARRKHDGKPGRNRQKSRRSIPSKSADGARANPPSNSSRPTDRCSRSKDRAGAGHSRARFCRRRKRTARTAAGFSPSRRRSTSKNRLPADGDKVFPFRGEFVKLVLTAPAGVVEGERNHVASFRIEEIVRGVPHQPEGWAGEQPFFLDAAERPNGRVRDVVQLIVVQAIADKPAQGFRELVFDTRPKPARIQYVGFLFLLIVGEIHDALSRRRQKMRLGKENRARGFDGRIFGEERQAPAAAQPIQVAPFELGAKLILRAVAHGGSISHP